MLQYLYYITATDATQQKGIISLITNT